MKDDRQRPWAGACSEGSIDSPRQPQMASTPALTPPRRSRLRWFHRRVGVKCRGKGGEIAGGYSRKAPPRTAARSASVDVLVMVMVDSLECAVLVLKG